MHGVVTFVPLCQSALSLHLLSEISCLHLTHVELVLQRVNESVVRDSAKGSVCGVQQSSACLVCPQTCAQLWQRANAGTAHQQTPLLAVKCLQASASLAMQDPHQRS